MPVTPWTAARSATPGKEYLVLVSYLPLRHFRALPRFFRFSVAIRRQLRSSSGLIGYSLDAQPLRRRFWTLSVWEDRESLEKFVAELPHAQVMKALAAHMGKSKFAQWTVGSRDIPPDWGSAKARLSER
jgi:Domain of unknown function (DUF3291)